MKNPECLRGESFQKCGALSPFILFIASKPNTHTKDTELSKKDQGHKLMVSKRCLWTSSSPPPAVKQKRATYRVSSRIPVVNMWAKSYWMTGWKSHLLSWPLTSRSDVVRVRQGEKGGQNENYRWARRAFSSGEQTPLLLFWEARWAIVWHGKAFCLMRERERERVDSFAGTCGTAPAEMSIQKWWRHSPITWLIIQLSAALSSDIFTVFSSARKDSNRICCMRPFLGIPSWLLATD